MRSMDSIDVTNRKPRKFKGTPSFKVRNNISLAVVAYSLIAGALMIFSPITRNIREAFDVLGQAKIYEQENPDEDEARNKSMLLAYLSTLNKKKPYEFEEESENPKE